MERGLYLESYKVIPTRNYLGASGEVDPSNPGHQICFNTLLRCLKAHDVLRARVVLHQFDDLQVRRLL